MYQYTKTVTATIITAPVLPTEIRTITVTDNEFLSFDFFMLINVDTIVPADEVVPELAEFVVTIPVVVGPKVVSADVVDKGLLVDNAAVVSEVVGCDSPEEIVVA